MSSKLQEILSSVPHGKVDPKSELGGQVLNELGKVWDELQGSKNASTTGEKVAARSEDVTWDGTILSFVLERHGGTVNGSVYAELHRWIVDPLLLTARMMGSGKRQLKPKQKAIGKEDLLRIAESTFQDIKNEVPQDFYLLTKDRKKVQIYLNRLLPSAAK